MAVSLNARIWWEVQRLDRQATWFMPHWITLYYCPTGEPLRFSTQANALTFLGQFRATHPTVPASDFRLIHIFL